MLLRSFSLAALACTAIQISPAQQNDQPPAKWSVVMITTIKPEMRTEYENLQKQVVTALRKAEVPSRTMLETVFGNLNEYVSITPLSKFAVMDGDGPLQRGLGKEPAAALLRKLSACVTSQRRLSSLEVDELSIRSGSPPPPLAMVSFYMMNPGKMPEFNSWMRDEYLPAMRKAEVKDLWVSAIVHGGDMAERVIVRPLKAMADLDNGPPTTKALGVEASRKMMAKRASFIEANHSAVMRFRPDLSYTLGSTGSAKQPGGSK